MRFAIISILKMKKQRYVNQFAVASDQTSRGKKKDIFTNCCY